MNWIYSYRSMMDSNDLSIDYQLMEVVRKELIQLHCENVSWERASDKIPLELVRYLLGDLVPYLSTLVFLRGNRCLFLLEWPQTIDSDEAWNYMLANSIGKKTYMEVGQYRFTYMLSHVGLGRNLLPCSLASARPQFQTGGCMEIREIVALRPS